MEYRIKAARSFEKELKRLTKRYVSMADDYERLLSDWEVNPHNLVPTLGAAFAKSVWQ